MSPSVGRYSASTQASQLESPCSSSVWLLAVYMRSISPNGSAIGPVYRVRGIYLVHAGVPINLFAMCQLRGCSRGIRTVVL